MTVWEVWQGNTLICSAAMGLTEHEARNKVENERRHGRRMEARPGGRVNARPAPEKIEWECRYLDKPKSGCPDREWDDSFLAFANDIVTAAERAQAHINTHLPGCVLVEIRRSRED